MDIRNIGQGTGGAGMGDEGTPKLGQTWPRGRLSEPTGIQESPGDARTAGLTVHAPWPAPMDFVRDVLRGGRTVASTFTTRARFGRNPHELQAWVARLPCSSFCTIR
jgi:hypothetical protein